uniref:Putative reverse transcriptase, RNA-dependent DNA polymerase, Gag-polypeptide of LTR copia-type n=1 Tax=Tanacetum cinerariifolium TaxID=118510 RepID=A0A699IXB4_TANCI|nr:putative reverse transcriptase, RNA-dependent DNA polymerase, Gag-polypeptide of LTR copia-type [Tanacetum cinerariifolium]
MRLDDVYQLITSSLLTRDAIPRDPIPNVKSAFSVIFKEESHRGSSSSSSENKAQAFVFAAKIHNNWRIPLYFWRECVLTAIYVINRLPYSLLKEDDASDGSDIDSTLLGDFPSAVNREMVTTSYDDITMEQNSTFEENFKITNVNTDQPNLRKSSTMNKEMEALYRIETWDITNLALGRKPIGCKWIYKSKYKSIREIERFKASEMPD